MPSLFNQQISQTYQGLLKTTSNGVLSPTLSQITDGNGNGSQLYLSTSKINFYNAYEFPTNDGSANQVLKTDGDGVLTWEDDANAGGVQVSGTPTLNQIAIWTDATTIKGMSALEIDVNDKITLDQDASSYNIGGGNIANVTGTNNTGFGLENLNVVTSGDGNVAIGYRALKSLTIGGSNTAIGYNSLEFLSNLVDGHNGNTAVGLSSGRRNNGGFNTFIGFQSGQGSINTSNNNSFNNTALGYFSLNKLTSGNSNTGVGSSALEDNTTGVLNTCLGQGSGREITTGSKNVILGSFTGFSGGTDIRTSDNNIIISDGSGNNRIQVDSGGNVGIGVTPTDAHQISRTSGTTQDAKNIQLRIGSSTTSLAPYIRFQGQTSSSVNRFADIQLDTVNDLLSFFPPSQYANAPSALNITSGGNVGIGTALPDATGFGWNVLTIQGGSSGGEAGVLELKTGAANIVNENLGVIAFLNGSTRVAQIDAISEGSNNTSAINFYTHNNTSMEKRLTISSGGLATFQNGIKFGGIPTPNYDSGADTLDAYEEGSWTPSITDSSDVAANLDSNNSVGVYTRVGNLVYFRATIQITSYPSPAPNSSSVAFIKGFPYTSATIPGNWYRPSSVITRYITFSGYLNLHVNANSDYGYLFDSVSASNGGAVEFSKYTSNSTLSISGVYEI